MGWPPVIVALLAGSFAVAQVRPEEMAIEQRDARAREIYENGTILYEEGLYEDAIVAFQESYRISGLHKLLLNVVNCYERLSRYEEAIAVLNRYRAFATPGERDQLRSRIASNYRRIASTEGYEPSGVTALPIPDVRAPLPRPAPRTATRSDPVE